MKFDFLEYHEFWSFLFTDSLAVHHRSHTYTNTLWGELAAHPSTVEEPKGDTLESLPSQCQRAEREKWQSTPVTEAMEDKDTHTCAHRHAHTSVYTKRAETVRYPQRKSKSWQRLSVLSSIIDRRDDILMLYWSLPSLCSTTGVSGGI